MSCSVSPPKEKYERLPTHTKPRHYDLLLEPDLDKFTFDGRVSISVDILEATNELKLHANSLAVNTASLRLESGEVVSETKIVLDPKWETLSVLFQGEVKPQKATLELEFTGEINDKLSGFYRSSYKTPEGEEKFIASTQFESTYARLSFPCWDEPIYKATFDVTLVVDQHFVALSNMDVVSETEEPDRKRKAVKFARTPVMSTYLVAYAVGDFEFLESHTESGTRMRVYTVRGKKHLGKFGLDIATKAINWFSFKYNKWFGITYPLPKCDLIAIPDFGMGAMENWGLVTYREVLLLVDETKSSTRQKSDVALVIGHELAHLWFGDLVTMKWWTDVWLKEGFASFMEYLFVGYNCPEFQIWLHFVNDEMTRGFNLDALRSSHPIEVEIDNPNELDEIYDGITYSKANSVNRMLCEYLGEETFQKGLRIYLNRFQYSNAVTVDLWQALSEASGQDITTLMCGWTQQMGYPLVSVDEKVEGTKRILKLRQKRFLVDGGDGEGLWQVPINISIASNPADVHFKILLKEESAEVELEGVPEGDWIKLNAGISGFYRVEYSPSMLARLLPDVSSGRLPVLDRFNLTNDLFALVEAGKTIADQFLHLFSASLNEEEYIVWGALLSGLGDLVNVLGQANDDERLKSMFKEWIVKSLEPVGKRLGWEAASGEHGQRSMLRSLVQARLGKSGHQPTLEKARTLFDEHIKEGKELHPDLRLTVYTLALIHDQKGSTVHEALLHKFETCGFSAVERDCIIALSQNPNLELLQKFYDYAFVKNKVRSQDLILVFVGAAASLANMNFAWSFFKSYLPILLQKFGDVNSSLFQRCLKLATSPHARLSVAQDIENFFCSDAITDADRRTLDRPLRQVLESVRNNSKLLERNYDILYVLLLNDSLKNSL